MSSPDALPAGGSEVTSGVPCNQSTVQKGPAPKQLTAKEKAPAFTVQTLSWKGDGLLTLTQGLYTVTTRNVSNRLFFLRCLACNEYDICDTCYFLETGDKERISATKPHGS